MVSFLVTTDATGQLTIQVTSDASPHPDLLDELATRTAWLFSEAYAQLPDADEVGEAPDDGGTDVAVG